jgi:hypothetical protein
MDSKKQVSFLDGDDASPQAVAEPSYVVAAAANVLRHRQFRIRSCCRIRLSSTLRMLNILQSSQMTMFLGRYA